LAVARCRAAGRPAQSTASNYVPVSFVAQRSPLFTGAAAIAAEAAPLYGEVERLDVGGIAMPTVKIVADEGALAVVYLNDAAVGRGAANRREDVLLVQFFLNTLWGKRDRTGVFGGSGPAPAIDGACGPSTISAIEQFQKWYEGTSGFIDGRVDPVPPGQRVGPHHHQVFTILGLNVNYAFSFGKERHFTLFKDPKFPVMLKPALFA
jgi:hypothetical protein